MALGQAAGTAAALALAAGIAPAAVPIRDLQAALLADAAVLVHFPNLDPTDPRFTAVQLRALDGAPDACTAATSATFVADERRGTVASP